MTPLAYRVTDALAITGLGRTKLYELIADGTLKTSKIGRARLIHAASLEALVSTGHGIERGIENHEIQKRIIKQEVA